VDLVLSSVESTWPVGTTVHAYLQGDFPNGWDAADGLPAGIVSRGNAAVQADGSLTIAGLDPDTKYRLGADVGGDFRTMTHYLAPPMGVNPEFGAFTDGQAAVWDEAAGEFVGAALSTAPDFGAFADGEIPVWDDGTDEFVGEPMPTFDGTPYRHGGGLPGLLAPDPAFGVSQAAMTNDRIFIGRFHVSEPITITSIAFAVQAVGAAAGNVNVGIYDSAKNLVVSSGVTASTLNATGVKTVNIADTVLAEGTYYCAYLADTQATLYTDNIAGGHLANLFGADVPNTIHGYKNQAFGALPAALGALGGIIGGVPIMALIEA
jgi:hypothetical protein